MEDVSILIWEVFKHEKMIKFKRIIKAFLMMFCFVSLSFMVLRFSFANNGQNVIRVPSEGFPTIQAAIYNATSGTTIIVEKGIYHENLVINQSVSIVGQGIDATVIDGSGIGNVVSIEGVDNVSIGGLTIGNSSDLQSGIFISFSNGDLVEGVKIVGNAIGISVFYSSGNNVFANSVISNSRNLGIGLQFSSSSLFLNNSIVDNPVGMDLASSGNNIFQGNTLRNNSIGADFFSSRNNILFHNNFYDSVTTDDLSNVWSQAGEGNYWHNYAGGDSDQDGIGDESHIIGSTNRDDYPLMGAFSGFSIDLNQETYFVDLICNSTVTGFLSEIGPETGNRIMRASLSGVEGDTGFCRVKFPVALMSQALMVFSSDEEIVFRSLNVTGATDKILYFTFMSGNHTVSVVSSRTLSLYNALLDTYLKLQTDLNDLNGTYRVFLDSYASLLLNYTELEIKYQQLNASLQEHTANQFQDAENIRNITYILAGTTAVFLVTTVYLSRRMHAERKSREFAAQKSER